MKSRIDIDAEFEYQSTQEGKALVLDFVYLVAFGMVLAIVSLFGVLKIIHDCVN